MANNDSRFLALLRGINVGGKNIIAKQDLKACFEGLGFANVRTYIQSGNILFRSDKKDVAELTRLVEQGLSSRFSYAARAVVLSYEQYVEAVDSAPKDWGKDEQQKHNALFTLASITPTEFLAKLPPQKPEIEAVKAGQNVVFWSVSKADAGRATMMKLASSPLYREVTIRNHNTAFKLLELFNEI